MKSAGKARNNGLYRHIRTSKEIIRNLLNDYLKNTSSRSYMDEFLAGNGVYVQPEFELATSDMIVQFVRRNLGVGCVMRDFARDYVESGLLFELRFNKMIPKRQFCVVRNTKMPMAPAAEKLLEIMELDVAAATL